MRVDDKSFYVVEAPGDDHVVATEDEAIQTLADGPDLDPETDDVSVAQVTFGGDEWTIEQLPWQQIALKLLQE